jgi:hypothetical protein
MAGFGRSACWTNSKTSSGKGSDFTCLPARKVPPFKDFIKSGYLYLFYVASPREASSWTKLIDEVLRDDKLIVHITPIVSMAKKTSPGELVVIPVERIEQQIYLIRREKVMIDSDLAELYQVTTGNLNLAVRRNAGRFPQDFMFQLTKEETTSLLLQSARTKKQRGGRQTPPYAFTEQGVAMLASVLNSDRAIAVNI